MDNEKVKKVVEGDSRYDITVFTPTYNRAHLLKRLYDSLCTQTDRHFIWLVVDDGSTDNTRELILGWQRQNVIKIQYFRQKNGGKHVAHNTGVNLCKTLYFVCVDSDDWLPENAVNTIKPLLKSI